MLTKNLFNKVIYKGIVGAITGIVAGLLLGLMIWSLTEAVSFSRTFLEKSPYGGYSSSLPPVEFMAFLGMGFGSVIGSVGGILVAFKEGKK